MRQLATAPDGVALEIVDNGAGWHCLREDEDFVAHGFMADLRKLARTRADARCSLSESPPFSFRTEPITWKTYP